MNLEEEKTQRQLAAALQFAVWATAILLVFLGASTISRALGYLSIGGILWLDVFLGKILSSRRTKDETK